MAALEALELPHLDGVAEWRALCARVDAARQLEPEPPSALRAELRPYQREGYRWLARLSAWDAGCCLADDRGLGSIAVPIGQRSEPIWRPVTCSTRRRR